MRVKMTPKPPTDGQLYQLAKSKGAFYDESTDKHQRLNNDCRAVCVDIVNLHYHIKKGYRALSAASLRRLR